MKLKIWVNAIAYEGKQPKELVQKSLNKSIKAFAEAVRNKDVQVLLQDNYVDDIEYSPKTDTTIATFSMPYSAEESTDIETLFEEVIYRD